MDSTRRGQSGLQASETHYGLSNRLFLVRLEYLFDLAGPRSFGVLELGYKGKLPDFVILLFAALSTLWWGHFSSASTLCTTRII